jgi:hypothetical protein
LNQRRGESLAAFCFVLTWIGDISAECFDSRRRVNSTIGWLAPERNAMLIAIAIMLGITGFAGLLLFVQALFRRNKRAIPSEKFAERKHQHIFRGMTSFWTSAAGLLFLLTGYFGPVEILVGVAGCQALFYALSLVKPQELFGGGGK